MPSFRNDDVEKMTTTLLQTNEETETHTLGAGNPNTKVKTSTESRESILSKSSTRNEENSSKNFQIGDEVDYFFDTHAFDPTGNIRYMLRHKETPDWLTFGKTHGWVEAKVIGISEEPPPPPEEEESVGDPGGPLIQIQLQPSCSSELQEVRSGKVMHLLDESSPFTRWTTEKYCRHRRGKSGKQGPGQGPATQVPATQVPAVTLLMVRWRDFYSDKRWSDYKITNEGPMQTLFEEGLYKVGGTAFECWTFWVENTRQMQWLRADHAVEVMRRHEGQKIVAAYYLWPSQMPMYTLRRKPGMIGDQTFFYCMEDMESRGIATAYPAPSHLYRQLCGKQYYNQACLNPHLHVPATTRVYYSDLFCPTTPTTGFTNSTATNSTTTTATPTFEHPPAADRAAKNALYTLNEIAKRKRGVTANVGAGVVKLGFSWMGLDVYFWNNEEELSKILLKAFANNRGTSCLVQELISDRLCELRVHVFADQAASSTGNGRKFMYKVRYMKNYSCDIAGVSKSDTFDMASNVSCSSEEALVDSSIFNGNRQALRRAEEKAQNIVDAWLAWYSTEWNSSLSVPANGRFDFLLSWPKEDQVLGSLGDATSIDIHTCEVTECGASLCGLSPKIRAISIANLMLQMCATTNGGDTKSSESSPLPLERTVLAH